MDWQQFWNKQASYRDEMKQVARTTNTQMLTKQQLDEHVQFIVETLHLRGKEMLLDVCCGNGVFTKLLAKQVKKTIGVDYAEKLIDNANVLEEGVCFEKANAMYLYNWPNYESYIKRFDVITICFSFQYFDTVEKGFMVIKQLVPLLKHGGKILLTDVPERAHFFKYYNNLGKIISLIKQMAIGVNYMGKFWAEEELEFICSENGLSGRKIKQPERFPFAHYRMDYLISKP
jgi:ubiquinone/menaquinone biosynthesis C-methylase UbiE